MGAAASLYQRQGYVHACSAGNADAAMAELAAVNSIPDHIAPDLARAVEWIVNRDC